LMAPLAAMSLMACGAAPAAGPAADAPPEPPVHYFPPVDAGGEWERTSTIEAGLDPAAVAAALSFAREQGSSGVVILFDGRIVAEERWEVGDPTARYSRMVTGRTASGHAVEDVASVQKSVVSFLVGVAEGKGVLDLDAPVSDYLSAGWSSAPVDKEEAITVEHLLAMTSGLGIDGSYEVPPGERWQYNTRMYSKMLGVLEAATDLSTDDYTRQWLTEPTGMADSGWTPRPRVGNQDANAVGFSTSARDLARFGLMLQRAGRWESDDLLGNVGYIGRSTSPSQTLNEAYGYLWWLNGQASGLRAGGQAFSGSYIPSAPDDLYAAAGALGRMLYVVPSRKLVVTRLGDAPGAGFNPEFWRLLLGGSS